MKNWCLLIMAVCLLAGIVVGSSMAGVVLPGPLTGDGIWLNETVASGDYTGM